MSQTASNSWSSTEIGNGDRRFKFSFFKNLNPENLTERQAKILMEDAENYRSIQHKLDHKSLDMYDLSHSVYLNALHNVSIVLLFLLPFIEWPSSLTMSSDIRLGLYRPRAPCGVTETIEMVCLIILIVQSVSLAKAFGKSWVLQNPWLVGKFVLFIIYIVDLMVSLCFRCNEFYRIRRLIRPYFLISNSQLMKKVIKCFKRTIPKLFSILFLLLFWLVSATLVAITLFSKSNDNQNGINNVRQIEKNETAELFVDFYETMFSLLVTITTANHPDVLIPIYNINRASALFSIVYLGVGLYVFMNILTAVVYSEFSGYLLSSVQTRLTRRRVATRAAFEILKINENGMELVHSNDVKQLIDSIRISAWKKEALSEIYLANFAESDLNSQQFMLLFQTLDLPGPLNQQHYRYIHSSRFAHALQTWIMSVNFEKLSISVSVLNVIYLCVNVSTSPSGNHPSFEMRIVNWCFVLFYLLEQTLLFWAYGRKPYFARKSNIFSLVMVITLFIVKLIELFLFLSSMYGYHIGSFQFTIWDLVRVTNILLLSRATRVVNLFSWSRLVASVLVDLPQNLSPVLGILISIYYFYALLGMNLFYDAIKFTKSSDNSTQTYECGIYQQLDYWPINFNDFAASIVLLWDLMVVNNWFVIVEAYRKAVNKWVHLYMVSWWLLAVVCMLSLVTAFIIETFSHRRNLHNKIAEYSAHSVEVVHIASNSTCESMNGVVHSTPVVKCKYGSIQHHMQDTIVVQPCSTFERRSSNVINPSTLDELFRSNLHEPNEDSLLCEINNHPYFQQMKL